MIPPGLEPGTFRVLGERDNHYTTESDKSFEIWPHQKKIKLVINFTAFSLFILQ